MRKNKLLLLAALNIFIGMFLYGKLRILLYRVLLGYQISYKAHLGLFPIIIAGKVRIEEGASIGHLAKIIDCKRFRLGPGSKIYRTALIGGLETFYLGRNSIVGVGTRIFSRHIDRKVNKMINGGRFIAGDMVAINARNSFDVSGNILLKKDIIIGGTGTFFYTHSSDCYRNLSYGDIIVCRNVYIGAGCIFLPGVRIAPECVIAAGSIVSRSAPEKGVYAGCPIKKISDDPTSRQFLIKKY